MAEADRDQALWDVLATVRPMDLMRAVTLMERVASRAFADLERGPERAPLHLRKGIRGRAERAQSSARVLRRLADALEAQQGQQQPAAEGAQG